MKSTDTTDARDEMFVALYYAVLEGLFENSRSDDRQFTQLAFDILSRMDEAYREVTSDQW